MMTGTNRTLRRRRRVSISALVALVLAGLVPGLAAAEDRYALLIGSNLAPPGKVRLRYAVDDARKFADVLRAHGNIAGENIRVLTNPTAAAVQRALTKLKERAERAGGQRHLLFYYSGHADDEALLLGEDKVPLDDVRDMLEDTSFDVRIAVVDACQSASLTQVKGATRVAPYEIEWRPVEKLKGAILIASSSAEESSVESDDVGGSLFTHFWVSGLHGAADFDENGEISAGEAFRYAYAHTVSRSAHTRAGTQHPTYEYKLTGRSDYVITRPKTLSAAFVFSDGLRGSYLVFDRDRDAIIAEVVKEDGETRVLAVSPGDYYLKKRQRENVLLEKVSLGSGDRYQVRDNNMSTVPYDEDVTKGQFSSEFEPTWAYGAPPVTDTAYLLRRQEISIGIVQPTAYGVSDGAMLYTSLAKNVLLTPNIGIRLRLAQGSAGTFSFDARYQQSFLNKVFNDPGVLGGTGQGGILVRSDRSELKFTGIFSWTVPFGRYVHFTMLGGAGFTSLPYDELFQGSDGNIVSTGLEAVEVQGGGGFVFLMGEHDMIQIHAVASYLPVVTIESVTDPDRSIMLSWEGKFMYAHAFGTFRLGIGAITAYPDKYLDNKLPALPFIDLWWRW